jgi:hypothetical protein
LFRLTLGLFAFPHDRQSAHELIESAHHHR